MRWLLRSRASLNNLTFVYAWQKSYEVWWTAFYLAPGDYTFEIYDAGGNGLIGPYPSGGSYTGWYEIRMLIYGEIQLVVPRTKGKFSERTSIEFNVPLVIPTFSPTHAPSATPSDTPSAKPSQTPTMKPSSEPSQAPTQTPSATPTNSPTTFPSQEPTNTPSFTPSDAPTTTPSAIPTGIPTVPPTDAPSPTPSSVPTQHPTVTPMPTTEQPSNEPTAGIFSPSRRQRENNSTAEGQINGKPAATSAATFIGGVHSMLLLFFYLAAVTL